MSVDTATLKRQTHSWARWLHVYASMICLVVVLFFSVTGLTLNHPGWTLGDDPTTETHDGTFPFDIVDDGEVDFLAISEYVRSEFDVGGTVTSHDIVGTDGAITYRNPGYSADLFFDTSSGSFDLSIEQSGAVAVMNDLHKGRDTAPFWRWVIDISAAALVLISLTGLCMQFFLRKRRTSALSLAAGGGVLLVLLMWFVVT